MQGPSILLNPSSWSLFSETSDWGYEKLNLDTNIYLGTVSYGTVSEFLPDPEIFSSLQRLLGCTYNIHQFPYVYMNKLKKLNYGKKTMYTQGHARNYYHMD